ncbi:hypothetical protein D910_11471 [Dendroctonus ponderosae]|uniref:Uncharacterized protein n=1 Tax=Dendroctonus ponderosae TaxID=77166 RepID=U4UJC6_DENPD|nr:hypothetical protein D910_11471 [Dendroctonus ponderosae]
MASLACPLCCSEQFSSHLELNNHILGMIDNIDNLYCPSCKEPCEDLVDLADHLTKECVNLPKSAGPKSATADIKVKIEPPNTTISDNVIIFVG